MADLEDQSAEIPADADAQLEKAVSVGSLLRSEFKKAKTAREAPREAAPAMDRTNAPAEAAKPAGERVRGPDGKFTTAEMAPVAAALEPGKESNASPTEQGAQPASKPTGDPPGGWTAEAKQEWAKLSPAVQQAVLKRETEVSDGFKKFGEKARFADELEAVIAPRRQFYSQTGRSDAEVVNQLWAWNEALLKNPTQAFPALAKLFGVNLQSPQTQPNQTPGAQSQPDGQGASQPDISQYLNPIVSRLNQYEEERRRESDQRTASEIQNWAKDKPHFDRVKVEMGRLMQAGLAMDLDSAYRKAIRANDEVYADTQREEEAKRAKDKADADLKAKEAAKAAAVKAKTASVSVRSSAPIVGAATKGPPKGKSVRETLMAARAEVSGSRV